jgi:hypothetical protein
MGDVRRTEGQPHDRLTRLCEAMGDALKAHPEYRDGDKAIVMLVDDKRLGIGLHGYDDDPDAAETDLLAHLQTMFEANGKTLILAPFGADPRSN